MIIHFRADERITNRYGIDNDTCAQFYDKYILFENFQHNGHFINIKMLRNGDRNELKCITIMQT